MIAKKQLLATMERHSLAIILIGIALAGAIVIAVAVIHDGRINNQQNQQLMTAHEEKYNEESQKANANFQGTAHDSFICQLTNINTESVSFDNGASWWTDDGRCAPNLKKHIEARSEEQERREQEARQQAQQQRDDDAGMHSYYSTTLRVDTDMNSSWLADEERTCQTYPNQEGRVAIVSCDAGTGKTTHNIPVVFWGGVDRNTISGWKCRREKDLLSDQFVCRAIN